MINYNSLDNKLKSVVKLLEDAEEKQRVREERARNKQRGYSSKCSVCNDPQLEAIEELHANGYTLREIKDELKLDVSIMALSRHFRNHYTKKEIYRLQQEKILLTKLTGTFIEYPYLEDFFKDKPIEYIETFKNEYGYCTDALRLCPFVEAGTVGNAEKIQNQYTDEILAENKKSYYSVNTGTMIKGLLIKNTCNTCVNNTLLERLELLESLVCKKVLNTDIEPNEILYTYKNFNKDKEAFINDLAKIE